MGVRPPKLGIRRRCFVPCRPGRCKGKFIPVLNEEELLYIWRNILIKKQLIDQSAHFIIGFIATVIAMTWLPAIYPAIAVISFAIGREFGQHNDMPKGFGSLFDVIFWTLGTLVAIWI